ncbi:MAG: 50S ribosomal protein L13 [Eubacteriaceae bacterium]|nr:50S ribosomal protein L13 [Eubacteriaceae bacterium]
MLTRTTATAKPEQIKHNWHVIDAEGVALGRLASEAASLIRGKHKPYFSPHLDTGDFVIVINAEKVKLTGDKLNKKLYFRHTGYPGGVKLTPYKDLMEKKPTFAVEKAVKGMLPKNRLGRKLFKKLKVYAGPTHNHQAQMPEPYVVKG